MGWDAGKVRKRKYLNLRTELKLFAKDKFTFYFYTFDRKKEILSYELTFNFVKKDDSSLSYNQNQWLHNTYHAYI